MIRRAVIVSAATFVLGVLLQAQDSPLQGPRSFPQSSLASPLSHSTSITGWVRSSDNKPVRDVRVELRDGRTGQIVTSAYTGTSGDFEFSGVPQGTYHVVALSGTQEAEEVVEANWSAVVNLRLPARSQSADDGGRNSISVAQYRVPEKAREELRKAREASIKGRIEDAQSHVERALELYPAYADALTFRAILKLTVKETESAVADLERAIATDGNNAMAYMVLGSAFNIEAKYDDAIRALERGESLAPDAWQAYFEMGKAFAGKSDFKGSLAQLNRALTLAPPDYTLIRLVRAHVLMQLHQYGDAVADLEAYLERKPTGQDADIAQKLLEQAKASVR